MPCLKSLSQPHFERINTIILAAVLIGFLSSGCDIPDRPSLLSDRTVGRQLSAEQIAELDEQVRRQSPDQTLRGSIPTAPQVGQSLWYAVETPSVAAAGTQTVGRRHFSTLEAAQSEPDSAIGDAARAAVAVEQLDEIWVGQNDCSIVSSVRITELLSTEGQLIESRVERGFGPLVDRTVLARRGDKLESQPSAANDFPARLMPAASAWSDIDRGELAHRQAISEMSLAIDSADTADRWAMVAREFSSARPSAHRQIQPFENADSDGDNTVAMPVRLLSQRQTSVPLWGGGNRRLQEFTVSWMRDGNPQQQLVAWVDQSEAKSGSSADANGSATGGPVIARMLRFDGLIDVLAPSEDQIKTPPRPPGNAAVRLTGKRFSDQDSLVAFRIDCLRGRIESAVGQQVRRLRNEVGGDSAESDSMETVRLLVAESGGGTREGFDSYQSPPQPADTAQTVLIDFGQRSLTQVIEATRIGAGSGDDSVPMANQVDNIASTIRSVVTTEPLQYTYRPASAVINQGSAGPISQAVLLSALLRGNGIPSRIAMGLRGVEDLPSDLHSDLHSDDPNGDRNGDQTGDLPTDESVAAVKSSDDKPQKYWGWIGFDVWVIAHWDDQWHNVDVDVEQLPMPVSRITLAICQPDPRSIEESIQRTIQTMSKMKIEVAGTR